MHDKKEISHGIKLSKFRNYSFDTFLQQTPFTPINEHPTRKHIGLTRTKKISREQISFPSFLQAQRPSSQTLSKSDEELNNKYNKIKSIAQDHPTKKEDRLFSEISEIQTSIESILNERKKFQEDHKAWIEKRKRIIADVYKDASFYSRADETGPKLLFPIN